MNRRRAEKGLFLAAVWLLVLASGLFGQTRTDESGYRSFVNSIGKLMFFYAWPSDTYDHVEMGDIRWAENGADVSVVLYGKSWLEGRVWTEVVASIRNGSVTDIRFGRNNGMVPPGATMGALGGLLKSLNDEYQRQHPQQQAGVATTPRPTPRVPAAPVRETSGVGVLCLNNTTSAAIGYAVPSEQIGWRTLDPGKTWMFWHDYEDTNFTVQFSASTEGGDARKTVAVTGAVARAKPESCEQRMTYDFLASEGQIGLTPETWISGTEHPFAANLIRSQTEGNWVCAKGYHWLTPEDLKSLNCISDSIGLLGVDLKIEEGSSYPRIMSVRAGGSAEQAGVPAGSYLVRVDGASMEGLSIDDVVSRTRGPLSSSVRIGVVVAGGDQIQFFDLTRR